jgi:hypothetical protein
MHLFAVRLAVFDVLKEKGAVREFSFANILYFSSLLLLILLLTNRKTGKWVQQVRIYTSCSFQILYLTVIPDDFRHALRKARGTKLVLLVSVLRRFYCIAKRTQRFRNHVSVLRY